jgi:hypothetical protein
MSPPNVNRLDWMMRHLAHTWIVVLSGNLVVIFLILFATLGTQPPNGAPGVVRLQLAFSKDTFRDILDQWGPDAVQTYRDYLPLDYFFPPVYAIFLSSALAVLVRRPGRLVRGLVVLPYLAVPFDYLKNTLHLILLRGDDTLAAGLILVASLAAAVKWTLLAVALLAVAIAFVWRLAMAVRGRVN